MSKPVLIGEIIASILADLKALDMDAVFEAEWEDVTDLLRRPAIRRYELEIRIGNGEVDTVRNNGRTYCKKSDLVKYFGTADFSVKIRRRNGK